MVSPLGPPFGAALWGQRGPSRSEPFSLWEKCMVFNPLSLSRASKLARPQSCQSWSSPPCTEETQQTAFPVFLEQAPNSLHLRQNSLHHASLQMQREQGHFCSSPMAWGCSSSLCCTPSLGKAEKLFSYLILSTCATLRYIQLLTLPTCDGWT